MSDGAPTSEFALPSLVDGRSLIDARFALREDLAQAIDICMQHYEIAALCLEARDDIGTFRAMTFAGIAALHSAKLAVDLKKADTAAAHFRRTRR